MIHWSSEKEKRLVKLQRQIVFTLGSLSVVAFAAFFIEQEVRMLLVAAWTFGILSLFCQYADEAKIDPQQKDEDALRSLELPKSGLRQIKHLRIIK